MKPFFSKKISFANETFLLEKEHERWIQEYETTLEKGLKMVQTL